MRHCIEPVALYQVQSRLLDVTDVVNDHATIRRRTVCLRTNSGSIHVTCDVDRIEYPVFAIDSDTAVVSHRA